MTTRTGRQGRRSVGLLVLAAAAALALSTVAASPALGHDEAPGVLPDGDWTEEQAHFAIDLVNRVEAALPSFSDPAALEELGFFDFGVTAPGGWDHYINPAWFDDGHILDPQHPEALVFRRVGGEYRLEAAMFYLTSQHDMSNLPADIGWLPGWHVHDELCVDEQGRYAGLVAGDGTCTVGTPADMPPMMHVWAVDNSCGHRFAGIGVGGIECGGEHDHTGPGPDGDDGSSDAQSPDAEHDVDDPGTMEADHPDNADAPDNADNPDNRDDPDTATDRRPAGMTVPSARPARPVRGEPNYVG